MQTRQFAGYIAVATLVVAGIALGLWMVVRLQELVVLVLIALVLTAGIAPLVDKLERRRMPRVAAILAVYLVVFLVFSAILAFVGTTIVKQGVVFSENLPKYITGARELMTHYEARYPKLKPLLPNISQMIEQAPSQLRSLEARALESVPQVFGFLGSAISIILILVLSIYMLLSREQLRDSVLAMIPEAHRPAAREMFAEMGRRIGGWFRGQLLLAAIMGVVTTVGLLALGVPYAGLIGLVAATAELIPMVGAAIASIPAILVALIGGSTFQLVGVIVFFIILAQFDSHYLVPRIMQKQVGLSPLATIIALLAGATLLGAIGAFLAIPIAAALSVFFSTVINPAIKRAGENHDQEKG